MPVICPGRPTDNQGEINFRSEFFSSKNYPKTGREWNAGRGWPQSSSSSSPSSKNIHDASSADIKGEAMENFSTRSWTTIPAPSVSYSAHEVKKIVSAASASFLNLIYHGAGMAVHHLLHGEAPLTLVEHRPYFVYPGWGPYLGTYRGGRW